MKYEPVNGGMPSDHPLRKGPLVYSLGQEPIESTPPESQEPSEDVPPEEDKGSNSDNSEMK